MCESAQQTDGPLMRNASFLELCMCDVHLVFVAPDLYTVDVGFLLGIAFEVDGSRLKHSHAADIRGRNRHVRG